MYTYIANEVVSLFTKNGLSIREARDVMKEVLVILSEKAIK